MLNVLLAVSLLNEYLHNKFMQDYLANTFSSTSLVLPVGLVAAAAVAGGSYTVYSRRTRDSVTHESEGLATENSLGPEKKLSVMDTCPFCNVTLKNISENRFQCRKCRRYFKK